MVLTNRPAPQQAAAPAPILLSEYRFPTASAPALIGVQAPSSSPFAPESSAASVTPVVALGATAAPERVGTFGAASATNFPRASADTNLRPVGTQPNGRSEPKKGPPALGQKTASLTPADAGPRPDSPPRPMVEIKKSSVVPELHTALPAVRYRGVLTATEIVRIKHNLRLTPDQEPAWPPVEAALAEMGRQQIALLRQGQEPRISPTDWPPGRLYAVAGPFLQILRPDQKETVRRLCRSLGFENVASMI